MTPISAPSVPRLSITLNALACLALLFCLLLPTGCGTDERWTTGVGDDPDPADSDSGETGDPEDEVTDEPPAEDEEDITEEEEEDPEEPEEPVEDEVGPLLSAGTWVVTESEVTEDGCGLTGQVDRGTPGSTMDLLPTGELSFDLTFTSDGEVTHCSLEDEMDFGCLAYSGTDERPAEYGLSAVILVERNSWGSFDSSESLRLVSDVFLQCQGSDCGWVNILLGSNFPCSMEMESLFAPDLPAAIRPASGGDSLAQD
jgi:hypothetical protein